MHWRHIWHVSRDNAYFSPPCVSVVDTILLPLNAIRASLAANIGSDRLWKEQVVMFFPKPCLKASGMALVIKRSNESRATLLLPLVCNGASKVSPLRTWTHDATELVLLTSNWVTRSSVSEKSISERLYLKRLYVWKRLHRKHLWLKKVTSCYPCEKWLDQEIMW